MVLIGEIIIALLGIGGFILANYIRDTKKTSAPLVCPLEGSCETVINSKYAKFLGIPVEILGILYYGLIALAYFLFAAYPWFLPDIVHIIILGLSFCAFVFSLYLTAIQSFFLKHWCTWCLISAGICTIIMIISATISSSIILEIVGNI